MGIPVPKPNHKRRKPSQAKRSAFPKKVRDNIVKRDRGLCQNCFHEGTEIHHVKPRSQMGRGVYTNGMLICHSCHDFLHKHRRTMLKWQEKYIYAYGEDYYQDEWD